MLGVDNMRIGLDMRDYPGFGGHVGGMAAYPASFAGGAAGAVGPYGSAAHSFGHMTNYATPAMAAPHSGQLAYENQGSPYGFENAPADIEDSRDSDNPPITPPPARERFSYTRYQLELLNGIFVTIRYPNSIQKQLIAKRVGITRDQVKIWFQNRRRKDVVASQGKGKSSPTAMEKPPSGMVPDRIMSGIVSELNKYDGDPKGKKLKEKLAASGGANSNGGGHRRKPYDRPASAQRRPSSSAESSPPSLDTSVSPPAMTLSYPSMSSHDYPALASYQGSNLHTSPSYGHQHYTAISPASSTTDQRLSGEFKSVYRMDQHYETESVSSAEDNENKIVGYIPSNEQLDMIAPPNAIAPPSSSLPELNADQLCKLESPKCSVSRESSPTCEPAVSAATSVLTMPRTSPVDAAPVHRLLGQLSPCENEPANNDNSLSYQSGDLVHPMMAAQQHCLPGYPPNQTAPANYYDLHSVRQFAQQQEKAAVPSDRMFPFSLHADPAAMMRSAMPAHYNTDFYYMNEAYRQPSGDYRDHYQSLLLSQFNNQYFAPHHDRGTAVVDSKSYAQL